jgi:hypothetical protein
MPRKNDWERRFGAIRRAKDKAYCEAAERAIAAEEETARETIAKAFGRPIIKDQKRERT